MTADTAARIGPNAIIQVAAALRATVDDECLRQIFAAAGLSDCIDHPPEAMVDETAVARLHQTVRATLPATLATEIMTDAGRRTGEYVLARRIPAPVRVVLPRLPVFLARKLLLKAIRGNAWTFAGSGQFSVQDDGSSCRVAIRTNPVVSGEVAAEPVCHWHSAVFATLFQRLVASDFQVFETECCAAGSEVCRFDIRRVQTVAKTDRRT